MAVAVAEQPMVAQVRQGVMVAVAQGLFQQLLTLRLAQQIQVAVAVAVQVTELTVAMVDQA
jgi:hypothetical protein